MVLKMKAPQFAQTVPVWHVICSANFNELGGWELPPVREKSAQGTAG
jgi:hypothetical protein